MDQIIVEWDREHLLAATGQVTGGRVILNAVSRIERSGEASSDMANARDMAGQLRNLFSQSGARSPQPVTVLLPRQSVTVHRISLPQVPDSELPDMVRLQASMKLTVPIDSVSLDFVPLPPVAGSPTRDVLLVTTPAEQIAIIRKTLAEAELELRSVRATSFCIAAAAVHAGLLSDEPLQNRVDAIVLLRPDFIEVTFTKQRSVVFSHSGASWSSADGIEKAVRSELIRARMAAAEMLGEHRVGRVLLIGRNEITSAVTDDIASKVDGAKIERIDPTHGMLDVSSDSGVAPELLVAIAGAIYAEAEQRVAGVDLINPRRPPEKRDLRRVKILGGTLAALVVFALVWNWRQSQMKVLSSELATVQGATGKLQEALKLGKPDLDLAASVEDWLARDIQWLDELQTLQTLLPSTDRFLLRDVKFDIKQGADIGTIRLDARAKTTADIEEIARRLNSAGYVVQPYTPQPSQRDPGYPYSITINLIIPERTLTKAEPVKAVSDSGQKAASAI